VVITGSGNQVQVACCIGWPICKNLRDQMRNMHPREFFACATLANFIRWLLAKVPATKTPARRKRHRRAKTGRPAVARACLVERPPADLAASCALLSRGPPSKASAAGSEGSRGGPQPYPPIACPLKDVPGWVAHHAGTRTSQRSPQGKPFVTIHVIQMAWNATSMAAHLTKPTFFTHSTSATWSIVVVLQSFPNHEG